MEVKPDIETLAKIKVIGVGGAGNSAVNRMVANKVKGVDFIAINTDAQALHQSQAKKKVHIGKSATRGLGAGMDPELGRKAAEENQEELKEILKGSDMVFITCGLGGGTGTGASPIVADIAKELGALTVAVVTRPFSFEGEQRRSIAEGGLRELSSKVDTIITIPNDRLLQVIDKKTSLLEAFRVVDDVLGQGVQGISNLITIPGLINVDFADVKSIMSSTGSALMGIGRGSGENRAIDAAKSAIDSPLLELSIEGAKGILFTITGNSELGMHEVNEAAKVITEKVDPNARIIFGSVIDDSFSEEIQITVIATGFGAAGRSSKKVNPKSRTAFSIDGEEEREKSPMRSPYLTPIEDEPAPLSRNDDFISKPLTPREMRGESLEVPAADEDEQKYEVPAFIRKKMM